MRLTVLSDIHLEYRSEFKSIISKLNKHQNTDLCILAGDIGYASQPIYSRFLHEICRIFPKVIVISGNHEYFPSHKIKDIDSNIKEICEKNKCIYLNKSSVIIDDFKIIGCTLWSDIGNFIKNLNLNNAIYSTKIQSNLHYEHVSWLKEELKLRREKTIVVTHYCPSFQMRSEIYPLTRFSKYFYSNLDLLITTPVCLWLCGHSHQPNKQIINGIPVIMNPVGHSEESILCKWNDKLIIKME